MCWFQGCRRSTGLPSGSLRDEHLLALPVVVVRRAEQDPDAQVDVDQVVGDQLAVHHDARRDEHRPAPLGHVLVVEVADRGVLEGSPAAEQRTPQPDLLVAGQRLVEEVEQVVVHRHDLLHELDVAHQPAQVVGHQLDGGDRADPARVQRGRVDVPALHQAEHLAGVPADLQRLAVEVAGERVERPHDVADGAITMITGVRRLGPVGLLQHARIGLGDHPLAVVHPDQVLLEDVVVEHVLGGLAEVDDPLAQVRRLHPVGHVLRVAGAGRVVVAADPADPAGDEVRVARVLALHEDRVAAEDRGGAVALGDDLLLEVDLGVDAEAADDPGDRVPGHLDQAVGVFGERGWAWPWSMSRACSLCGAETLAAYQVRLAPVVSSGPGLAPLGFLVDRVRWSRARSLRRVRRPRP